MTRRKSPAEQRRGQMLAVIAAYERHAGATTQREDAAAELGMDLSEFRDVLDYARRMGWNVER